MPGWNQHPGRRGKGRTKLRRRIFYQTERGEAMSNVRSEPIKDGKPHRQWDVAFLTL